MKTFTSLLVFTLFSLSAFSQSALQVIKGTILDQELETPLIGAFVELVDLEGVGSTTDLDGNFLISDIPAGRHELKISYIGYHSQFIPNLVVTSGKEVVIEVKLEEKSFELDQVVVTAETEKDRTNNEMTSISGRSFTLEEVTRFSGGRNDVSRLVSNYAGVSTADDSRNDIVIRGNSPTGVLWRLDGVAIPNPNHFSTLGTTGGPVSALNTNLLKNSDFLSSAFPAEYGNALSGVFDIGFRSGNKDKFETTLQLAAFSGLEVMVEGPLNKKKTSSFLLSYRHSFVQLASSLGVDIGTNATPDYRDLSFKFDFAKTKFGKLSLFGIGATSNIEFLAAETDTQDLFAESDADSKAESILGIIGIKHSLMLNDRTYLRTVFSANTAGNNFTVERYMDLDLREKMDYSNFDDKISKQIFRTYVNTKVTSKNTMRVGLNIERQFINSFASDRTNNPDLDGDGLPDEIILRDIEDDVYTYELFFHNKYKLSEKATFQVGMHGQVLSLSEKGFLEPRLGFNYDVNSSHRLSLGYGLHAQAPPLPFMLTIGPDIKGNPSLVNKNLDFTKAQHIVMGWDWKIAESWRSKVEVYHQRLFDVPVEEMASSFSVLNYGADFGFPSIGKLVNKGFGENYGIELTIEKFFSKGFYGLLTGSLYQSKYQGSDKIERNTAFNNNLVVNLLGGKEFKLNERKALTVDFKFTNAGGRYYTPVDLEASRIIEGQVLIEEEAFSLKYDPYMRIDLKVGLSINSKTKKFAQQFYLDFQNVTNRENIFAKRYNRATNEINTLYQSGFFPDLMYRVQF